MKLKQIGSNQTVISIGDDSVLFSYETPVAACIDGVFYRTEKHWSTTTSKHLNSWLKLNAVKMPQSWFDSLLEVNLTILV